MARGEARCGTRLRGVGDGCRDGGLRVVRCEAERSGEPVKGAGCQCDGAALGGG